MGSNHIDTGPEIIIQRWDKEKRYTVDSRTPQIIEQYNKFVGGADTLDMLVESHSNLNVGIQELYGEFSI